MWKGSPALFCEITVDWHEHNVLVKASFPTPLDVQECAAEIPYEYPVDQDNFVEAIARPNETLTEGVLLVAVEAGDERSA